LTSGKVPDPSPVSEGPPAGARRVAVLVDPLEAGTGVDGGVALEVAPQPRELVALDRAEVPGVGQARAVAAAEPQHLQRRAVAGEQGVVVDGLLQGEQRVDRALHQQGGDPDARDEVGRAAGGEVVDLGLGERPGGQPVGEGLHEHRVQAVVGPGLAEAGEDRRPPALDRLLLVQAGHQGVPGDVGDDHVDALVQGRRHELDAAAVARAGHAEARVVRGVELGLGLLGDVVDERLDVTALGVRRVDRDGAAALAEPARIPREDVEAGGA
jgi:hypothetical protein